MGKFLAAAGYNGLRTFMYVMSLILTITLLVLTGILVNISKRHSNFYARGPMSWALFMSCFSFVTLIPLFFFNQIRAFRRKRSSGSAVRRDTSWIEPALLFLNTFLWVTATIAIATQSSFLNCGLSRCHTARTAVVLSIILIPFLAFLTAITLLNGYRHHFMVSGNSTAPHTTTGAGFQGPGATAGGYMGTTAFDAGGHQPQYNDKMAGGPPEPGMMSSAPATGAAGNTYISSPVAQPNPVGGGGGYNPNMNVGPEGAPIVEGTQVQPAMPEARV
ncbi:hypothetical protein IWQ62_004707 [Dispira parvispora]|uniref:MARVEL domain-containing protein n=1 Tax=Dispira parvispora TaxID=1520584 RepID=A0A9W8E1Q8_9FUNG|nr:hypothetical protein IWQ62_004707 [Dispira parvispora]